MPDPDLTAAIHRLASAVEAMAEKAVSTNVARGRYPDRSGGNGSAASEKQVKWVKDLCYQQRLDYTEFVTGQLGRGEVGTLTKQEASKLIEQLRAGR